MHTVVLLAWAEWITKKVNSRESIVVTMTKARDSGLNYNHSNDKL